MCFSQNFSSVLWGSRLQLETRCQLTGWNRQAIVDDSQRPGIVSCHQLSLWLCDFLVRFIAGSWWPLSASLSCSEYSSSLCLDQRFSNATWCMYVLKISRDSKSNQITDRGVNYKCHCRIYCKSRTFRSYNFQSTWIRDLI